MTTWTEADGRPVEVKRAEGLQHDFQLYTEAESLTMNPFGWIEQ